jgi:hypothetical protein
VSADLQQVSTVAGDGELGHRDGAPVQTKLLGTEPSHKQPKKTKQQLLQEKKKRALAGGASASSSGASS